MSSEHSHWYHCFSNECHQLWSFYYSDSRLKFLEADLPFCSQIRTSHCPMCWKRWSAKQEGGRYIRISECNDIGPDLCISNSRWVPLPGTSLISLELKKYLPFTAPNATHTHSQLEHLLQATMTQWNKDPSLYSFHKQGNCSTIRLLKIIHLRNRSELKDKLSDSKTHLLNHTRYFLFYLEEICPKFQKPKIFQMVTCMSWVMNGTSLHSWGLWLNSNARLASHLLFL